MWDDIGYIMASNYRKLIVEKLKYKNYLPSTLAKELKIQLSHISRALSELKRKNVVECLNETSKKGKIYTLTELGKKISEKIESEL